MTLDELLAVAKPRKETCGVYVLLHGRDVIYVGRSKNIEARLIAHRRKRFTSVSIIECDHDQAVALEIELIRRFRPEANDQFNQPSAGGRMKLLGRMKRARSKAERDWLISQMPSSVRRSCRKMNATA